MSFFFFSRRKILRIYFPSWSLKEDQISQMTFHAAVNHRQNKLLKYQHGKVEIWFSFFEFPDGQIQKNGALYTAL